MGQHWGWHLSLDVKNCDPSKVTDPELIDQFTRVLVKAIDMVPFGDPQVFHFADHCPDKAGWTMVQMLQTSNACCHFLDYGDAYFDLFSCKSFDPVIVKQLFADYFAPEKFVRERFFVRSTARRTIADVLEDAGRKIVKLFR